MIRDLKKIANVGYSYFVSTKLTAVVTILE